MFASRTDRSGSPEITSPRNPLLKDVRRAAERGGLTPDGLAVAEGFHLLQEALRSGCPVETILCSQAALPALERIPGVHGDLPVVTVADQALASAASVETTQGVISLVRPPVHAIDALFSAVPLVTVLDGVQDPGNLGTILRTAEAFGASGALLLKGCVNPWNPKAMRASAGSVFRLPMVTGADAESAIAGFSRRGVRLWAAMPRGEVSVSEADLAAPAGLVIGSEGQGVSSALSVAATHFSIPTQGVESLNAAIAAGVALYEAARQRGGRR